MIKIFDRDYLDIPLFELSVGDIVVSHDPQKRLGAITWSVVLVISGQFPEARGLFWEKNDAVNYARTLERLIQDDQDWNKRATG